MSSNNKGWIRLHRKLTESEYYFTEPFCRTMAWIDLLLLANHDSHTLFIRGNKVVVNRGQVGYSFEQLRVRWKWGVAKVRKFLIDLENSGQIERQKSNIKPLITIVNYDQYQSDHMPDRTPDRRPDHMPDRRANKNEKNENNENKVLNTKRKIEKNFDIAWPAGMDDRWPGLWQAYKEYRIRERKGWFKTGKTEQQALDNLIADSFGDYTVAEAIVKKTIGSGWTGLFPIKQQPNGTSKGNKQSTNGAGKTTDTLFGISEVRDF